MQKRVAPLHSQTTGNENNHPDNFRLNFEKA
ncbi:hypothetical protein B879_03366 [Cecembia lonarensis LW9]|uniref:Uncharacterized protein n=1 Tax=Cecembia lonarensis (strain CCUG 58316 / KCTC 22772 / LW9) TaxID=1225176 RepID=K1KUZ8_CECL9|nr:hypothetical protein B879_03366 [Cecembia lonarensis LW9]